MELYKQIDNHVAPEGFLFTGEIRVPNEDDYWLAGSCYEPGEIAVASNQRLCAWATMPKSKRYILARIADEKGPGYPTFEPGDIVRIEPMDENVTDSPGFRNTYVSELGKAAGKVAVVANQTKVGVCLRNAKYTFPPTKLTKLERI